MTNPSLKLVVDNLTLANVGPGALFSTLVWEPSRKVFTITMTFQHGDKQVILSAGGNTTSLPIKSAPTSLLQNGQPVACYGEWTGANFYLHTGSQVIHSLQTDVERFIAAVFQSIHVHPVIPVKPQDSDKHSLSTGAIVGIAVGGGVLVAVVIILAVVLSRKHRALKHNNLA